jgi:hypothetical protein
MSLPGTELLQRCAFGGCGKPWNDSAHIHMVTYQCSDPHDEDNYCHRYRCPLHGRSGDVDDGGYSSCSRCVIETLRVKLAAGKL